MGKIRRFLKLTRSERGLLLKAAFFLLAVRLGLSLLPFRIFRRFLERVLRSAALPAAPVPSAERIAQAIASASRHLPGTRNCLVRALATQIFLHRMGYQASLRIGVRRDSAAPLAAHAWVEEQGNVRIGGSETGRFVPLEPAEFR